MSGRLVDVCGVSVGYLLGAVPQGERTRGVVAEFVAAKDGKP